MTAKDLGLPKELMDKITSKFWRLNHLYYIRDKDGKTVKLKLNKAQVTVFKDFRHNKKIILKSRQRGISTGYAIYQLDDCIFKPGTQAGVQSYGKDEAEKLKMKIDLAWEMFPEVIKEALKLTTVKDNTQMLEFSNGSTIKIGNFRGDTLQLLHVSELGKIAKKYPEKARELKTGAFQSVSVNNKITIESTAEGRSGLFYEMWTKAVLKQKTGMALTPLDFQPIFLSWIDDEDCRLTTPVIVTPEREKYFSDLENQLQIKIPDEARWWWMAKYDELGFEMFQEYPATPEEAFAQSVEGTYYKNEYENLKLITNSYRPELLVHMAFDLGMNDTFSIGFFQTWFDQGVRHTRIIGYYSNEGQGLQHYRDILDYISLDKGWVFDITYVPHDVSVRELIAGKSRWQALLDLGFNPILVPRHRVQDGIQATREFLIDVEIDAEEAIDIIDAIQNYKKKYDERLSVYLDTPVHDLYSHPADMLRYMAMGIKNSPPRNIYVTDIDNESYYIGPTSGYDV